MNDIVGGLLGMGAGVLFLLLLVGVAHLADWTVNR